MACQHKYTILDSQNVAHCRDCGAVVRKYPVWIDERQFLQELTPDQRKQYIMNKHEANHFKQREMASMPIGLDLL